MIGSGGSLRRNQRARPSPPRQAGVLPRPSRPSCEPPSTRRRRQGLLRLSVSLGSRHQKQAPPKAARTLRRLSRRSRRRVRRLGRRWRCHPPWSTTRRLSLLLARGRSRVRARRNGVMRRRKKFSQRTAPFNTPPCHRRPPPRPRPRPAAGTRQRRRRLRRLDSPARRRRRWRGLSRFAYRQARQRPPLQRASPGSRVLRRRRRPRPRSARPRRAANRRAAARRPPPLGSRLRTRTILGDGRSRRSRAMDGKRPSERAGGADSPRVPKAVPTRRPHRRRRARARRCT